MTRSNYLLVMTACIDPQNGGNKGIAQVNRADPVLRLRDYEQALRFWLRYPDHRIDRILLIENTGYSLKSLQEIAAYENKLNKTVEFISLVCNECPPGIHYGYAELNMLDLGLAQSTLAQKSDYLIKVTGRLVFPTLTRLLDRLPDDYEFAVDFREQRIWKPYKFVTTQLMIFSRSFYTEKLMDIKSKLSPEMPLIENLLYFELLRYASTPGAILRWSVNVDPVGYAAHTNTSYQSLKRRFVSLGRSICRKLLPNWWV